MFKHFTVVQPQPPLSFNDARGVLQTLGLALRVEKATQHPAETRYVYALKVYDEYARETRWILEFFDSEERHSAPTAQYASVGQLLRRFKDDEWDHTKWQLCTEVTPTLQDMTPADLIARHAMLLFQVEAAHQERALILAELERRHFKHTLPPVVKDAQDALADLSKWGFEELLDLTIDLQTSYHITTSQLARVGAELAKRDKEAGGDDTK